MTSEEHALLLRQQDRDRAEEEWRITERELDEMAWQYEYEEETMQRSERESFVEAIREQGEEIERLKTCVRYLLTEVRFRLQGEGSREAAGYRRYLDREEE